jgi:hypothetical protein
MCCALVSCWCSHSCIQAEKVVAHGGGFDVVTLTVDVQSVKAVLCADPTRRIEQLHRLGVHDNLVYWR